MWLKPRLPGIACFLSVLLIAHCSALAQRRRVYVSGKPAAQWSIRRGRSGKIQRDEMEVSHAVMLIGSPVEMAGRIYFGSTNGNLYSVDAETGALRWKFDAKSRIPSNPAVAEGTVYFTAYDGSFLRLTLPQAPSSGSFRRGERRFAGKHLHGVQPASETMPIPSTAIFRRRWFGKQRFSSAAGTGRFIRSMPHRARCIRNSRPGKIQTRTIRLGFNRRLRWSGARYISDAGIPISTQWRPAAERRGHRLRPMVPGWSLRQPYRTEQFILSPPTPAFRTPSMSPRAR
jgi:hypothetical protein